MPPISHNIDPGHIFLKVEFFGLPTPVLADSQQNNDHLANLMDKLQAPPQALRFSQVQASDSPSRFSFARTFSSRERRLGMRQDKLGKIHRLR